MKRTVLISSTILAIITVLELSQASKALPAPETAQPKVNTEVEVLLKSDISARRGGGRGVRVEMRMVIDIGVRDLSCLRRAKSRSYSRSTFIKCRDLGLAHWCQLKQ